MKPATAAVGEVRRNPDGTIAKGSKSPNPSGRRPVDPKVRDALIADTMPRLKTLERIAKKAEKKGDLKTAAHIHLSLLKKTVPDTTELLIPDLPAAVAANALVRRLDPRKMTEEQLKFVVEMQRAQSGG